MGEAVEECCCHLGVTEYTGPFTEAEIGRDDDAGLLVEARRNLDRFRGSQLHRETPTRSHTSRRQFRCHGINHPVRLYLRPD